jgi:hypothetical protein
MLGFCQIRGAVKGVTMSKQPVYYKRLCADDAVR